MEVTLNDVLESFGTSSLSGDCAEFLLSKDFSYEVLKGKEKEATVLAALKQIETDKQIIGARERAGIWEKGWKENLDSFCESGDLRDIVPKFIRPSTVMRFKQEFIRPSSNLFELNYCRLFQMWFFKEYIEPFETVYEFGCGSGFNLTSIHDIFPEKKLVGTDFVPSSVELINEIARQKSMNMEAHFFDMLNPGNLPIPANSCVLTFGALEQLAGKFHAFIGYLVDQKVKRCLHVEPTIELYDSDNLVDYLAIMFHRKRGYSEGLLPYLYTLDKEGKVRLIKVQRLRFGNDRMEGYNYVVWETL